MVQDDPIYNHPLSIIVDDKKFDMELTMKVNIVYSETHTPSEKELQECPHIVLSYEQPWHLNKIRFLKIKYTLSYTVEILRCIGLVITSLSEHEYV